MLASSSPLHTYVSAQALVQQFSRMMRAVHERARMGISPTGHDRVVRYIYVTGYVRSLCAASDHRESVAAPSRGSIDPSDRRHAHMRAQIAIDR